jgi:hypothetical protein
MVINPGGSRRILSCPFEIPSSGEVHVHREVHLHREAQAVLRELRRAMDPNLDNGIGGGIKI